MSKTGVLKSIELHKIPTVEFDFAAISVTACDGALLMYLPRSMGGGGGGFYPYILQHSF